MKHSFKKFLNSVKDALFPAGFTCDICGTETFGTNICGDCVGTLNFNDKACCPVCGRKTVRPEICAECKSVPPVFAKAVSAFVYEGGAQTLILKFKQGAGYLKDYFAECLTEKLEYLDFDCLISVPMTARARRRRGYNQSELLADAISEKLGVAVVKNAVEKRRETPEQKDLSKTERSKNLKGCYKVSDKSGIAGKRVLIVDDVLTTGATAEELAKTLLKSGAAKVFLATVASVEYKGLKTEES